MCRGVGIHGEPVSSASFQSLVSGDSKSTFDECGAESSPKHLQSKAYQGRLPDAWRRLLQPVLWIPCLFSCRATQPDVTPNRLAPASSTSRVYAQPKDPRPLLKACQQKTIGEAPRILHSNDPAPIQAYVQ